MKLHPLVIVLSVIAVLTFRGVAFSNDEDARQKITHMLDDLADDFSRPSDTSGLEFMQLKDAPDTSSLDFIGSPVSEKHDDAVISGARGNFIIEVTPSGQAAIDAFHQGRRAFYMQGHTDPDHMRKEDARLRASDPKVSMFLRINEAGELLGAYKATGNEYQPYQFWAYDLNDQGNLAKVVFSGGKRGKEKAVVVAGYDGNNKLLGLVALTVFDSNSILID